MKTLVWVEHEGGALKDATLAAVTAASKLGEVHLARRRQLQALPPLPRRSRALARCMSPMTRRYAMRLRKMSRR
jgi:hypothetical protein